jgi:aldehyde:ferredoxin oxidoreductase
MLAGDPLRNVLIIDLSRKRSRVESREDLFDRHIGGAGVAIRLLDEFCPKGADPLGPDNPIVLAVGPLVGHYPLASKTVGMFKSPHNGNLGESHCGGRTAVAIRMAGYGAIVIQGASDIPVYLSIQGGRVFFREATTLWGMSCSSTAARIIRQREPGAGLRSIMRIGRAGEKKVTYAGVAAETYRHFGRLGLGAVFGSKKLKALVVSGRRSLPEPELPAYRKAYDAIYRAAVESPAMKKYHDLGTPQNVLPLNRLRALPTRNLKEAQFEQAAAISGEAFAERYLGRRLACAHCPVACIHIAALREPHPVEPFFYKTSMISYDYELIYAMGAMLGVGNPEGLLALIDEVEESGLDIMTAGPVLSWATEAMERGLVTEKETGGLKFAWGESRVYAEAVRRIVDQATPFYAALARGVDHAASVFGGQDFAVALGGNEIPGYHTGPAAHAGFLAGARHSHLDNAGYSIDQAALRDGKTLTPEGLAEALVREESWRQVLSSLVICYFAREIYKSETVRETLRLTGFDVDDARLESFGREAYRDKVRFKQREGFSYEGLRIPKRILETPAPNPGLSEDFLRRTLRHVEAALKA